MHLYFHAHNDTRTHVQHNHLSKVLRLDFNPLLSRLDKL